MKKYSRVYVEITNICNRNCSFCPGTRREKRRMSLDEFRRVAERLIGVTDYIYLHVMGEPLRHPELDALRKTEAIDKITFGSKELANIIANEKDVESVTFVGLCTDICVISNVMTLKAFCPEIPIVVDAKGCAGVTEQSHMTALSAMRACQVEIING